jgi:transposase-like protein
MMACLNDEVSALRYLEAKLWRDGPVCPRCGARGPDDRLEGAATRIGEHKCQTCRRTFSITDGTIFEGSGVPLYKWLQAVYLTRGGAMPIRPHRLAAILDVSFQAANTMVQRLRITDPCPENTTVRALATDLQSIALCY